MKIAVDCMGGDFGVSATIPAIIKVLKTHANINIIAFGDSTQMQTEWNKHIGSKSKLSKKIEFRHTHEIVTMEDSPKSALKNKRESSMAMAIDSVKQNDAFAAISSGNTGALVAISRYLLKTIEGVDRPALVTPIPTIKNPVYIVDLGANVDCEVTHLVQFAKMTSVMLKAINGIDPKIGVLNIGTEVIKGNLVVKETIAELQKLEMNFIGSIEGDEVFQGKADIVVCDGFVGNVALKITEGVSYLIKYWIDQESRKNIFRKISALIALPIFNGVKHRRDPRIYNGATLLGLQGVVIKSHGAADEFAFRYAIEFAIDQIEQNVNQKIQDSVSAIIH